MKHNTSRQINRSMRFREIIPSTPQVAGVQVQDAKAVLQQAIPANSFYLWTVAFSTWRLME